MRGIDYFILIFISFNGNTNDYGNLLDIKKELNIECMSIEKG